MVKIAKTTSVSHLLIDTCNVLLEARTSKNRCLAIDLRNVDKVKKRAKR